MNTLTLIIMKIVSIIFIENEADSYATSYEACMLSEIKVETAYGCVGLLDYTERTLPDAKASCINLGGVLPAPLTTAEIEQIEVKIAQHARRWIPPLSYRRISSDCPDFVQDSTVVAGWICYNQPHAPNEGWYWELKNGTHFFEASQSWAVGEPNDYVAGEVGVVVYATAMVNGLRDVLSTTAAHTLCQFSECVEFRIESGMKFSAMANKTGLGSVDDLNSCGKICSVEPECVVFQYEQSTRTCYLSAQDFSIQTSYEAEIGANVYVKL